MSQNRLHEIFHELSPLELRELAKYVRSPLFNKKEKVIQLFDYMRKKKDKGWDDKKTFEHLYPNEQFNVQQLHYLNCALHKHIESYLIWKECRNSEIDSNLYLMKAYRKKHMDKPFNRILRKTEELLEEQPLRNEVYHAYQYEVQKEILYHQKEKKRGAAFKLQELSDIQDLCFISDKLKNACTILSHQTLTKKEYDQGLLDTILKKVALEKKYLEYPAIAIYYYAFKALSDFEDEESFLSLKQLLIEKIQLFSDKEQKDIYILAINYCIKRLNTGADRFIREAFETYRNGLKKDILIENGILSRWTYNNIIILGLKLKEFDWVESFIYDYKKHLDEATKEDSFNFNLAKFYLEKKDYKTVMPLLIQTKYDDLLHNLGAKMMLVKMYYELEEIDALENLLESFKTYILRKKDIGYHKENYLNIIAFVKKLIHINPYDRKELKTLGKDIEQTKILTEKKWLLHQVESME